MNNKKEGILWQKFLSGEEEAFAQLYKMCYSDLYAYGSAMEINQDVVKDGIQEVFLTLYTRRILLRDIDSLRAFLFRSLKNYLINNAIKEKRKLDIEGMDFSFFYTIEDAFIEHEERKIIYSKIKKIMNSLSPRQAECIYLRFQHEMSFVEISEVLGIGIQATRNLLFRALKKIRENYYNLYLLVGSYFWCFFMCENIVGK